MKDTQSTRDYIKNWGRTAARKQDAQHLEVLEHGIAIGNIHVFYHLHDAEWVWRGEILHRGSIYSSDCSCEREAREWVRAKHSYLSTRQTFGIWLCDIMSEFEVTQVQLSDILGVSRMTVYGWLNDTRSPSIENWTGIAKYFADRAECDVNDMLGIMYHLQRLQ